MAAAVARLEDWDAAGKIQVNMGRERQPVLVIE